MSKTSMYNYSLNYFKFMFNFNKHSYSYTTLLFLHMFNNYFNQKYNLPLVWKRERQKNLTLIQTNSQVG